MRRDGPPKHVEQVWSPGLPASRFGYKASHFGTKPTSRPINGVICVASESEEKERAMGELETRDTAKGRARIIYLAEAAEIIGTSYPTAVRLAESGELKAFRIRKSWRTSDAACDEFVRRQFELQALRCRSKAQGR